MPTSSGDCKILLSTSLVYVVSQEVRFLWLCVYAALKCVQSTSAMWFHRLHFVWDCLLKFYQKYPYGYHFILASLSCLFQHLSLITINSKQDRQCMYKRNIEVHSCYHCCIGEVNKYYIFWVCVCSLSYPASHMHVPYHISTFSSSGSTIFFHIISYTSWFWKKVIEHEICVLVFSSTFVWNLCYS